MFVQCKKKLSKAGISAIECFHSEREGEVKDRTKKKKIAKEVGRSFLKWGSLQIVPFTYWSKKVCVSSITATQSWKSNAHISVRSRFLTEVSAPESTSFELSTEFSVIPHPVQLEQFEHAM